MTESALNLRKFCEFLNKVLIYFPLERITKEIASWCGEIQKCQWKRTFSSRRVVRLHCNYTVECVKREWRVERRNGKPAGIE